MALIIRELIGSLPEMKTKRERLIILLVAVAVSLIGYSSLIYVPQYYRGLAYATSDEKASSVEMELVAANTRFAINIFKELVTEDDGKNIFISPFSISTALTMIYNGAEDSTKEAMAETLGFNDMELGKINQDYLNLLESLEKADRQVSLEVGNSVWMDKEFEPRVYPTFTETISTYYKGDIYARNFESTDTVEEINGWISDNTDGKIDRMVEVIDPDLVMFLINAIYFKGDWATKFDESRTSEGDFFLPDGSVVRPDIMSTSGEFSYYSDENFKAARLPYGRDKIAMYIFLPGKGVSLESFIISLNHTTFDDYIIRLLPVSDLNVKLPKFKLEYGTKRLNNALKKLGMGVTFDMHSANFSGIASVDQGNLYIDFVDHKAFIEVNEQGTEAIAATVVAVAVESEPQETTFYVNRPFFYVIRDDRPGSILFMGKIENPLEMHSP